MDCCCCCTESKPEPPQPPFNGVVQRRRCRDIICLAVFIAFWLGMLVICAVGVSKGSLARLIYGYDAYGFLCGTDNSDAFGNENGPDFRERKKLYYLNPLELLDPTLFHSAKRICVESCPTPEDVCDLTSGNLCTEQQFRCPYYRIGEKEIYDHLTGVTNWNTSYFDQLGTFLRDDISPANAPVGEPVSNTQEGNELQISSQIPGSGPCYPIWTQTVDYFNRCFPKFDESLQEFITDTLGDFSVVSTFSALKDEFGETGERIQHYVADITKGWLIIVFGGLCTSVVVSMVWMIVLRYFAGLMAWTTVLLVNAAFAGCTLFAFARSGKLGEIGSVGASIATKIPEDEDPTESERKIWLYVSITGVVLTGLLMLLTLVMIQRIRIAIAIIKVACQALGSMPSLLFFPLLPFLMEVFLVLYFVFISALLYSSGELTPKLRTHLDRISEAFGFEPDSESIPASLPSNITQEACALNPYCYYDMEWNVELMYMFLYHLFGLLWTNQFIIGFGYVVIAGAVGQFYWTRAHPTPTKTPLCTSMWNAFRYHLGSIALGSFIVAIVQFIRLILEYVDRKFKRMQKNGNSVVKYIFCCLKCFLWILEIVIKFINRNAYIMVAVKGTSYCRSAGRAASLLISNALRLAAINVIGDVLIWLGKLAVMASCGIVAFLLADREFYTDPDNHPDSYLSSPLMPILVSMLVGYVVADLFFEVFEMTIDAILLSFCEDCEAHDGQALYAPPLLMSVIGRSQEFHEKQNRS